MIAPGAEVIVTFFQPMEIGLNVEELVNANVVKPANVTTELAFKLARLMLLLVGTAMPSNVIAVQEATAGAICEYTVAMHVVPVEVSVELVLEVEEDTDEELDEEEVDEEVDEDEVEEEELETLEDEVLFELVLETLEDETLVELILELLEELVLEIEVEAEDFEETLLETDLELEVLDVVDVVTGAVHRHEHAVETLECRFSH